MSLRYQNSCFNQLCLLLHIYIFRGAVIFRRQRLCKTYSLDIPGTVKA